MLRTVLVVVLFRHVVLRHFLRAHFALVRVRSVFHSAHYPRFERLSFLQQFVRAFRVGALNHGNAAKIPALSPAAAARARRFNCTVSTLWLPTTTCVWRAGLLRAAGLRAAFCFGAFFFALNFVLAVTFFAPCFAFFTISVPSAAASLPPAPAPVIRTQDAKDAARASKEVQTGFACTNGPGVESCGCAAFAREKSQFIFALPVSPGPQIPPSTEQPPHSAAPRRP